MAHQILNTVDYLDWSLEKCFYVMRLLFNLSAEEVCRQCSVDPNLVYTELLPAYLRHPHADESFRSAYAPAYFALKGFVQERMTFLCAEIYTPFFDSEYDDDVAFNALLKVFNCPKKAIVYRVFGVRSNAFNFYMNTKNTKWTRELTQKQSDALRYIYECHIELARDYCEDYIAQHNQSLTLSAKDILDEKPPADYKQLLKRGRFNSRSTSIF
jgi:hypothetical protein